MSSVLDTEIRNVERAMRRAEERMQVLEEPFEFPADCCPSCACGPEWKDLASKLQRQAFVLSRLYVKRGGHNDARRAEILWWEYYDQSDAQWMAWRAKQAG